MDIKLRRILTYFTALLAVLISPACSSNTKRNTDSNYSQIMSSDSIPQVIKEIVTAINENDPELFAKEISYPLQRPYPLKDIQDMEQMKAYYTVVVDDSLRHVILSSKPDDWEQYGWRGYSLKDGSYLWVDDAIYSITYVSQKEKNMIDSLTLVELNSLPEDVTKGGWIPVLTLLSEENGQVYRIDKCTSTSDQDNPEYHLSVYDFNSDPKNLLKLPALMLNGKLQSEGSAVVESYVFHDKNGKEYIITPDDPEEGMPVIINPDGSQKVLKKAYWYELINPL